jgi:hypothetical protein
MRTKEVVLTKQVGTWVSRDDTSTVGTYEPTFEVQYSIMLAGYSVAERRCTAMAGGVSYCDTYKPPQVTLALRVLLETQPHVG